MLPIQRKISPYNHSGVNNIQYIVIHYTGNRGDTAKNNADYFYGGDRQASAHYVVDDNSIYKMETFYKSDNRIKTRTVQKTQCVENLEKIIRP